MTAMPTPTTVIARPHRASRPRKPGPSKLAVQAGRMLIVEAIGRYEAARDRFDALDAMSDQRPRDRHLAFWLSMAMARLDDAETELINVVLATDHATDLDAGTDYDRVAHPPRSIEHGGRVYAVAQEPDEPEVPIGGRLPGGYRIMWLTISGTAGSEPRSR